MGLHQTVRGRLANAIKGGAVPRLDNRSGY